MPPPLDVDREAVKTLALSVGIREAARQTGLPEGTVRQWSARGKWLDRPKQPPTVIPTTPTLAPGNSTVTAVTSPSKAMQNVLDGHKFKSKALLAKFVVNAAKVASRSRSPLADAQNVRHVAAVHSTLWPEEKAGSSNMVLNLGVAINTSSRE